MAEQVVTLEPSESKVITFEAVPHEAKTYHVSVDGLSESFVASLAPASLYGVVSDASTGRPIAGAKAIFNGRSTSTDATGSFTITDLKAGKLSIAFSHIDYEAYHVEVTLSPGENKLDVSLTPAVVGRIALYKGYNLVTYTGRLQTVGAAFASLSHLSFMQVLHFVDSAYYETTCRGTTECVESTKMMIPGDNYWIFVPQDCIWTF